MVINNDGEKMPSVYTPINPLSKSVALTVLFKKFCANRGFTPPQPPLPQVRTFRSCLTSGVKFGFSRLIISLNYVLLFSPKH